MAPGASRSWWFCGFPQQFLQRAWVDGNTVKPLCGRPRSHRGTLKKILYGKRRRILEPYGVEPGSRARYEYRYHQLSPYGAARRGAYESLAYGEAEDFRAAHPTPMDLSNFASVGRLGGIGRFNRKMDAMKGPSPAPSTQHPAPSTQHPAPSTQHPAPSTQHQHQHQHLHDHHSETISWEGALPEICV